MEQVQTDILFYDGYNARPAAVQVQLVNESLHLYEFYDQRFIQSFPLSGIHLNHVGSNYFIYLDPKGLIYLQLPADHPLVQQLEAEMGRVKRGWVQKLMRQKLALLVPLMLVLATGLYFLLLSLVPYLGLKLIEKESEISLGNQLHEVVLNEMSVFRRRDTTGTYLLQAFAKELELSSEYPIRVTLLRSSTVNAYALPGGRVVVFTGLLEKLETPESLAALLAHECTHVNERHSLRSLLRSGANSLLISILLGDATGISGALAGNIENLSGLRYSRGLEQQADELGMELMVKNRVSPQGMVQLMKVLEKQGDLPGQLSFLSSHPLTRERIKWATKFSEKHSNGNFNSERLQARFEQVKQAIKTEKATPF